MNNLQKMIDAMAKKERDEHLKNSPQLTLGELILLLEQVNNKELPLVYDNLTHPGYLMSWRGSYKELAISIATKGQPCSVSQFLPRLKSAIGETFAGYKGGEYVMGKRTPVWADNYGVGGHQGVVGVKELGHQVRIITQECEF